MMRTSPPTDTLGNGAECQAAEPLRPPMAGIEYEVQTNTSANIHGLHVDPGHLLAISSDHEEYPHTHPSIPYHSWIFSLVEHVSSDKLQSNVGSLSRIWRLNSEKLDTIQ